jgi:hypothetical protein
VSSTRFAALTIVLMVAECGGSPSPSPAAEADRLPWYQVETREANDQLAEIILRVGYQDGTTTATIPLPVNRNLDLPLFGLGFITGPANGVVVFGVDDGDRSKVQLVEVASGETSIIFESAEPVIAGAVHPAGSPLYLVTADRASDPMRIDARMVELALGDDRAAGEPAGRPWLGDAPVNRPEMFNVFHFTPDGSRLVVQRCRNSACSYRVVSLSDGSLAELEAAGGGEIVGISNEALIVHPADWGMTKEFQQVPLPGSNLPPMNLIGPVATVVTTEAGPMNVLGQGEQAGAGYVIVNPRTAEERRLATPRDLSGGLVGEPERQGFRPPPGWAVFAAEGRISREGLPMSLTLVHVLSGLALEVPSLE